MLIDPVRREARIDRTAVVPVDAAAVGGGEPAGFPGEVGFCADDWEPASDSSPARHEEKRTRFMGTGTERVCAADSLLPSQDLDSSRDVKVGWCQHPGGAAELLLLYARSRMGRRRHYRLGARVGRRPSETLENLVDFVKRRMPTRRLGIALELAEQPARLPELLRVTAHCNRRQTRGRNEIRTAVRSNVGTDDFGSLLGREAREFERLGLKRGLVSPHYLPSE